MRSIRLMVVLAAMALAGPSVAPTRAADDPAEQPFGGPPSPPGRHVEERPFGGPPPKHRAPQRSGGKCQTEQQTCPLEKRKPMGGKCTCPGADVEGKVIE